MTRINLRFQYLIVGFKMVKKVFFILVFGGLINWSWIGYDIFQAQEGKEQDKRKIENA